jgi:hypothetical protein
MSGKLDCTHWTAGSRPLEPIRLTECNRLITSVDLLRLRLLGLGSPQDQDVGQ